jgi:hypothetical protein
MLSQSPTAVRALPVEENKLLAKVPTPIAATANNGQLASICAENRDTTCAFSEVRECPATIAELADRLARFDSQFARVSVQGNVRVEGQALQAGSLRLDLDDDGIRRLCEHVSIPRKYAVKLDATAPLVYSGLLIPAARLDRRRSTASIQLSELDLRRWMSNFCERGRARAPGPAKRRERREPTALWPERRPGCIRIHQQTLVAIPYHR